MAQRIKNVFNSLDEHGVMLGLPRLQGEKNKDYKRRLLDVGANKGAATYPGLLNAMNRGLGLSSYDAMTISIKSGQTPDNPAVIINSAEILLYSDYPVTLEKTIELYDADRSNIAYTLNDTVTAITASTTFEAVLVDSTKGYERSTVIREQDNSIEVSNESVPLANRFSLKNTNIISSSISFSDVDVFISQAMSSNLSLMSPGDYYIDYDTGQITVATTPSGKGAISYQYRELPFSIVASPVILKDLGEEEFHKRIFEQETNYDGNVTNGAPKPEALDLIREVLTIKGLYWGR